MITAFTIRILSRKFIFALLLFVSIPGFSQWTQKADLTGGARYEAFGFSINGKGYIGGGAGSTGAKYDFWEYDPATNSWAQKANFGDGQTGAATAFSIGNKGYIL